METLVDTFPGQSIDFFGALRARVYDDKVREFVKDLGVENIGKRLVNSREGKVGCCSVSAEPLYCSCQPRCVACPGLFLEPACGAACHALEQPAAATGQAAKLA